MSHLIQFVLIYFWPNTFITAFLEVDIYVSYVCDIYALSPIKNDDISFSFHYLKSNWDLQARNQQLCSAGETEFLESSISINSLFAVY